jgi:hypothetical protein
MHSVCEMAEDIVFTTKLNFLYNLICLQGTGVSLDGKDQSWTQSWVYFLPRMFQIIFQGEIYTSSLIEVRICCAI